jgi:photosystem II stability/assembly factor-like uncharacterized protein
MKGSLMHLTRWSRYVAASGLVLVVSACSGDPGGVDRSFEPDHVHELAVEADSGRLLIATHDGLFELTRDGEPSAVNDLTTDLMGFTRAPTGDFFASGHPGAGEDGPSRLGLVTSTDGGDSFEEVSLGGQADFHALEATSTFVYGVDGGTRLLRSSDAGATWEELTLPQPVADLAADSDSESLVVTSELGLLLSNDAGETFTQVDGAPVLQLVDWADDGTLTGIDPSGQVYSANDPGSWTSGAKIEPAQAITTGPDGVVYVVTTGELLRSEDGGESFASVTRW